MGTIQKGILGPVNGKVGTVVGSRWRGIDYIRSRPGKRTSAPTSAQLVQQAKFELVASFISSIKSFVEISYKNSATNMTGRNAATSYVLKNAVTGVYPALSINYAMVKLSASSGLFNAAAPAATSTTAGKIDFSWADNSGIDAFASDKAMVVAYCPSLGKSAYNTAAAQRSDLSAVLDVAAFSGLAVQTWIMFITEDGKKISDSHYTGLVNVQ